MVDTVSPLRAPDVSALTKKLLSARKVPNSAFSVPHRINLYPLLTTIEREKKKPITVNKQLKMFNNTIDDIFERSYVYGISGKNHPRYAQAAALSLFVEAYNTAIKYKMNLPLWHVLKGNMDDSLRDSQTVDSYGKPSLLVLDGLAINSVRNKIEAARDLLEMYSDIPRIVISAGSCPRTFFYDALYQPVQKVLYFGDTVRSVTVI